MFCQRKSPHWNAAAKGFGACHDIRLYPVFLPCKHGSRPSHAALYFIQNQKNIMLPANLFYPHKKFFFCRINAAFSLNGFQQNGTGFFIHQRSNAIQMIVFCKFHDSWQRLKRFPVMRVSCYSQSPQAPSMEGMLHGDYFMICGSIFGICIFFRSFYRPFYGFRTTVSKKRPIQAGSSAEFFRRFYGGLIIIQVGGVKQLVYLSF